MAEIREGLIVNNSDQIDLAEYDNCVDVLILVLLVRGMVEDTTMQGLSDSKQA